MTQVGQTGTMVAQPSPLGGSNATGYVRSEPWTEEAYFGLGETAGRVELLDGSLLVSPPPTPQHQSLAYQLARKLEVAARRVDLEVFEAIGVRLATGRIFIPDVVVTHTLVDRNVSAINVNAVVLAAEVTSPSTRAADRTLKRSLYAAAGIPLYLRLERLGEPWLSIVLDRLQVSGWYSQAGETRPGREPIRFPLPGSNTDAIHVELHPDLFER